MNNDPEQPEFYDDLHSSFQKLKLQYEQEGLDPEPHLSTVVTEFLRLSRGNELPGFSCCELSSEVTRVRFAARDKSAVESGWRFPLPQRSDETIETDDGDSDEDQD